VRRGDGVLDRCADGARPLLTAGLLSLGLDGMGGAGAQTCSPSELRGISDAHELHLTVGRTTEARSMAAGGRWARRDMGGYAGTWEMRAGIRLERGRGVDEIEGVRAQKVDAQRRGDCALLEARSVVGCDARGGSSRAMGIGGVRPLN
jgi:hypothetical protein